jgi:hypothetical protein
VDTFHADESFRDLLFCDTVIIAAAAAGAGLLIGQLITRWVVGS